MERVWRPGRLPEPNRRPARLRRLAGSALTVILLAASGVVLYLRLHHAPIHVTGVVISQQTHTGCVVDVTGRITTNGSAGTVSYRWLFRPGQQAPQPLSQSVAAGQKAVYVTVAVEGQGHRPPPPPPPPPPQLPAFPRTEGSLGAAPSSLENPAASQALPAVAGPRPGPERPKATSSESPVKASQSSA